MQRDAQKLVVGGTGFLGGAIVDALVERGHRVAVVSRGVTARTLSEGVEVIEADRHGSLSALKGRHFDWVFDTCAFTPDAVSALLDALDTEPKRYILASSISTYGCYDKPGLTEAAEVPEASQDDFERAGAVPLENRGSAAAYGPSYGPLKRACEIVAEQKLGVRATALRIGLIVGAGDYTDRLTWWVRRFDEAGRSKSPTVVAPLPTDRPVQVLDVRDAARFAVLCAEHNLGGIWNVNGDVMTMQELLNEIHETTTSAGEIRWVSASAFLDAGAEPWTDVPLMAPDAPAFRHFLEVDAGRARSAGLETRPLRETLETLLRWDRTRRDKALICGLSAEQENQILDEVS
ncbi:NAD-dependent epimerase/dehydratase family protein [Synechococcus sp. MU1644]|nr:NAD-dependent epimerase/dehydratase family protein [Synechococcus sp. MU1644]